MLAYQQAPLISREAGLGPFGRTPVHSQSLQKNDFESKLLMRANPNPVIVPIEVIHPPEIYSHTHGAFISFDEGHKAKINAADNMVKSIDFLMESVEETKANLEWLGKENAGLRQSLRDMRDQAQKSQKEKAATLSDMLQKFRDDLKLSLQEDKNENFHLVREFQQLLREKLQLQQQVAYVRRRIDDLEGMVGINQTSNDKQ